MNNSLIFYRDLTPFFMMSLLKSFASSKIIFSIHVFDTRMLYLLLYIHLMLEKQFISNRQTLKNIGYECCK